MNQQEFLSVRSIFPNDTIDELRRARARNPLFDKEIREYKKWLEENDEIDENYKKLLFCIVNMGESFKPQKEMQDKDHVMECNDDGHSEEENDPQYEHFLKHLKEHDKFYALESEKEGVRVIHAYGEDSEEECDAKPRTKSKRARQEKIVPSDQRHVTRNQARNKVDEVQNATRSLHMILESHKECGIEIGKKVTKTRKQNVGPPSNPVPDVENRSFAAFEMPMRVTRSRVKLANVVLDSHKKCDTEHGKKVNRFQEQKGGSSDQMPDIENWPSNALEITTHVTRSGRKFNEVEALNMKASPTMVAKPKLGPKNQMTDVENMSEHNQDQQSSLVKKINGGTKRNSMDDAHHHLIQNVKLGDKGFQTESGRRVNVALKQEVGPSNQFPHVNKKHEHGRKKVTFEVDDDKDRLNDVVLDSHKEFDLEKMRKLNRTTKQKVGPSNQMPDVDKKCKHDPPSCSHKTTKCLTKRKIKLEDKDCHLQPKRKVNMKQNIRLSNRMPGVENKRKGDQQHHSLKKKRCLNRRILMNEVKIENMEPYSPTDLESYPEYVDLDDDKDNDMHKGANDVKKERLDYSDSKVEILDSEAIEKGISSTFVPSKRVHYSLEEHLRRSNEDSEFRKQLMNVLTKPFDKEEYKRHQKAAKCYLDRQPDLKRKLAKHRYSKGKRMTIYRGFLFWLQNLTQPGSFKPWTDSECLAIERGSPQSCKV